MNQENNTISVPTSKQSYAVPFAIIIAGLAIAGAIYFGDGKKGVAPLAVQDPTKAVVDAVASTDHIIGNPNAKVVIVEYSDLECPFCKSFHPTMERLMNEYAKDGQVAWVYRHWPLPFHTKAPHEAEATECANKLGGNTKFWEFANKVFEVTPGNNGLDEAELPKIAKNIGLDETAFATCLASGEMKTIVDKDLASGVKAGVQGTPFSFVLVDKKPVSSINGAQPYEAVKAVIDEALK